MALKSHPTPPKVKPQTPHRLLYARWIDAHALTDSWCTVDAIDDLQARVIETVGWHLAGLKPGHLVLAQSFDTEIEQVDNVIAIPLGMLRQVIDLELGAEHDFTKLR